MTKKTELQKLNDKASKTDEIIKVHQAGIVYAKASMAESAGLIVNKAAKVTKEAVDQKNRAQVLLNKYGN